MEIQRLFFSVVIPTHNRPSLLERALESVVTQDFASFEVIVVNDGSGVCYDETWMKFHARINKLIVHEEAKGISYARNSGINAAEGKWVVFLDDDDEYLPGFLKKMHAILNGAPEEIGFAWSSVIFKNYDSKGALSKPRYRRFKERDASGRRLHKAIIDVGSGFGLAVRKTCFERVGMFDPHFKLGEDTELFLRLMSSGYKPAICTDVGVAVHSHGGFARYFAGLRERTRTGVFLRLVERYLDFMSRHPALLVAIAGRGALISYLCGDFRSGDRLLAILARTIPAQPHGWASILKNVGARSVCKFIYVARLHPRHVNPEAQ